MALRIESTVSLLRDLISGFPEFPKTSSQIIPLRLKARDLVTGDVILPNFTKLNAAMHEELLKFVEQALAHSDVPVIKVLKDEHNLLTFHLNRHEVIKDIVSEVQSLGWKYGMCEAGKGHRVIFNNVATRQDKYLDQLRLSTVTSHAANLLTANGYDVHKLHEDTVSEGLGTTNTSVITDANKPSGQSSNHSKFVSQVEEFLKSQENREDWIARHLSTSRIVKDHGLQVGGDGVDENLQGVEVINNDGNFSDVLTEAIELEDRLDQVAKQGNEVQTCIHITSQQIAFWQLQVLLLKMDLSKKKIAQSQLIVGQVMAKQDGSLEEFYRMRYDQMKQASEMRYGKKCEGSDWETRLNLLTKAALTMDFLGTASHALLRLDVESSAPAERRLGAFALYNTARLATLLRHFHQEVERGVYPPLPDVEAIDFTLLREEEDWELAFLYIASFPGVVRDSVEVVSPSQGRIKAKIHTHKVVNFLTVFCKSLSSYYSRYHILGGSQAHLLPLMYARLHLMKVAHQVLVSALRLLDIPALDQL